MKKLILSLLAVIVMFSANAQATASDPYLTVTYLGYQNGQYGFQLTQHENCKDAKKYDFSTSWSSQINVSTVSPSNSGNIATSNYMTGATENFYYTAPYSATGSFTFTMLTNCNWQGQAPQALTVSIAQNLPVKWADFSLLRSHSDSTNLTVSWQTLTESNVKSYTLQGSADGGITWDNLTSINPNNNGNSPTAQNYSISYSDPLVATIIEAGFGLLGSLLIIGMIVSMISKKHKVLGGICAVLAIVCMVSCTKSNIAATPKHLKYKMFRVVETDLDGNTTYSIVMVG